MSSTVEIAPSKPAKAIHMYNMGMGDAVLSPSGKIYVRAENGYFIVFEHGRAPHLMFHADGILPLVGVVITVKRVE